MKQKPQPYYTNLNFNPKDPRHGKHWRPGKKAHGRAAKRTDFSAGDFTWATYSGTFAIDFAAPEPEPPGPIPYAGVRAGEIVASRGWRVTDKYELVSLAHYFIWEPGATVHGKLDEPISDNPFAVYFLRRRYPHMQGVYAFLDPAEAERDCEDFITLPYPYAEITSDDPTSRMPTLFNQQMLYGNGPVPDDFKQQYYATFIGFVLGTVKVWGEVVEHERGWRAESAKAVSIDKAFGGVDIERLRAKYFPAPS